MSMKLLFRAACLFVFPLIAAGETRVTPQIDSVELFKNGVAVIRASFEIPEPGLYLWDGMQRPVHGSLWMESDGAVGIQSTTRLVENGESNGAPTDTNLRVEKPVILFDVTDVPSDGGRLRVSYLARGIAWAPAYRLDLTEPDFLTIRQSAVVRNELLPLKDTELRLVSGFPNIQFSHVDSPLWAGGSLALFFQQLGQQRGVGVPLTTQQLITSNSVSANASPLLPDLAEAASSGDDLHFESIGKRSLAIGDSLSLEVASARSGYERVVEWVVPDPRDGQGRYLGARLAPRDEDQPWDALRFRNPFKFPMTTAPALITEGGRFRGQSLSQWVNPGQTTCLRITKALSIRAEYSEAEEEQEREVVWVGGNDFRRTKVKGTLLLHNSRGKEVTLSIRSSFSGDLLEADDKPASRLRTDGITSVNPRRELQWTLKLAPGEEKTLAFRYSVLVDQ